ncbi:hypothetical protein MHB42_16155 [Lysinibacillus sp. FSL K6-0232]|uniref:hypothetical protein n=1 Tax=unclassified Lysinibacillus TaxID=2636778 RepID=UPI0030F7A8F1
MKKISIPFLFLSFLLIACQDQQVNEPSSADSSKVTQEEDLSLSTEEWQQLALDSTWYRNSNIPSEDTYYKMVDFEGDQVPEIFIGYSGTNYGYIIGKFNKDNKSWSLWAAQQYETPIHGEVRFKDILKNNNDQELPLITIFSAGASNYTEVLHLLKVSDDGDKIISGQTYSLSMNRNLIVDTSTNSFTIQEENYLEHYELQDNAIISEYGTVKLNSGLPIIQNEKLLALLNNSFFKTGIIFGDSYSTAKIKAGTPVNEDYYEGGFCSFYDDYFFCLAEDEIPPSHFYLSKFKNVTRENLEKAINQTIQILSYERYGDPDDIVYFGEFEFEDVYYYAEFSNDQNNAALLNLSLSLVASTN